MRITFSRVEIEHLLRSFIFIALAFTIAEVGFNLSFMFMRVFVISAVAVGLGFILHELAHKIVAQRFGCWSEFRANQKMLWTALILSFFGFIFIAPGAVVTKGTLTRREQGHVSAAGPIANLVLAVFLLSFLLIGYRDFALYSLRINAFIALFNLIPIFPFDGIKVFRWNRYFWGLLVALSILLMFLERAL
jgi:Zn-dependent protease